jgi:nucleoside phosphorylase
MKGRVPVLVALTALAILPVASAAPRAPACRARLLVLSAFPAEIGPLLAQTQVQRTEVIDGRVFFVGRLKGNDVVLALTGIGLMNAAHTTRTALDHFACASGRGIDGIVFSGVSGGHTYIGDVTVPRRWTMDDGKTWSPADPRMLATARGAIARGIRLQKIAPLGDCACIGADPDAVKPITLPHAPQILVGGNGRSSDPFQGHTFPCVPAGGDVFGCQPCKYQRLFADDVPRFADGFSALFTDPNFFLKYKNSTTPPNYDADDMETAAVARVAASKQVPFIGFRALSDGLGDPLHGLGFPEQFFVYRQYAAENAAAVALAFLSAWSRT